MGDIAVARRWYLEKLNPSKLSLAAVEQISVNI